MKKYMYINSDRALPFYILNINHNYNLREISLVNFGDHLNIFKFLIYIECVTFTDKDFGSEYDDNEALSASDSLSSRMVILEWEVTLCGDCVLRFIMLVKNGTKESDIIGICARKRELFALDILFIFLGRLASWC
jgi:hypothetical protein